MTPKPPLDDLLHSGEWTHAEFKAARSALPKSAFASVSAIRHGGATKTAEG